MKSCIRKLDLMGIFKKMSGGGSSSKSPGENLTARDRDAVVVKVLESSEGSPNTETCRLALDMRTRMQAVVGRAVLIFYLLSLLASAPFLSPAKSAESRVFRSLDEALASPSTVESLNLGEYKPDISVLGYASAYRACLPDPGPVIEKLPNLRQLNLSRSLPTHKTEHSEDGVTEVPEAVFNLQKLVELDLSNNSLDGIPPDIGKLKSLKKLNLSGNDIRELPPEIGGLSELEELNLAGTGLESFPDVIIGLKKLRKLDLSSNLRLGRLPPEIRQLSNLAELNLAHTWLKIYPKEIFALRNLERLDLSGNRIGSLASEIGQLQKLKELKVKGIELTTLPPEIGKLEKLQILDVQNNRLTRLPQTLARLIRLEELYLGGNGFNAPPPLLFKLPKLQKLQWSAKSADKVPAALVRIPRLWLDLTAYDPDDMEASLKLVALRTFKNIEGLSLRQRRVDESLPEIGAFTNLVSLDLYGTTLDKIPPEILKLGRLEELDLSGTFVKSLPNGISSLSKLKTLSLSLGSAEFYPDSELAKLVPLPLQTLYLHENKGLDLIDVDLILALLPHTRLTIGIWSGADVEPTPEVKALARKSKGLLEDIQRILAAYPNLGLNLTDFLLLEAKEHVGTLKGQVEFRTNFKEFLRTKIRNLEKGDNPADKSG